MLSERSILGLLSTSVLVSVSGGFKVHLAFLMTNAETNPALCGASAFIIYSVYTLDRAFEPKEDEVNRREGAKANGKVAIVLASVFLMVGAVILSKEGIPPVVAFLPLMVGFLYAKGVKIGENTWKIKGSYGVKNFVVAFTWSSLLGVFIYTEVKCFSSLILVCVFFFVKSFINTVIYDCRDMEGDSVVGLKTIPIFLGRARTKVILHILHSLSHFILALLVLSGLAEMGTIVLLYSWGIGSIYIYFYVNSDRRNFRDVAIDGEWIHATIFRDFVTRLL